MVKRKKPKQLIYASVRNRLAARCGNSEPAGFGVGRSYRRETPQQGWRRSKKGNLWKEHEGETLTIFEHDGSYGWCIAGPGGDTEFSRHRFDSEDDAIEDLQRIL